jgi:hypothetical protein
VLPETALAEVENPRVAGFATRGLHYRATTVFRKKISVTVD